MPQPRVLYVLGTPPNFLKMAPVVAALRERLSDVRHVLVGTDQDYDRGLSDVLHAELHLPEPSYLLGVGSGGPASRTAYVMERLERVIDLDRPDLVIAAGDVDATLAATLAAVKLGVPTAHVESGLRSFDRNSPDEVNRIVADQFADFLFAPSEEAVDNLLAHDIAGDRIHFVGNTLVDSLIAVEARFREIRAAQRFGLSPGDYLLVALNGPSVDGPLSWDVLDRLKTVSRELPVLFPLRSGTRIRMEAYPARQALKLVEPPAYLDLLSLEADATAVLTDSGEVQDEATHLGIPCFALRDATERTTTLEQGTNVLLGSDPSRIAAILPALDDKPRPVEPPPLWDGRAGARVADVLEGVLDPARPAEPEKLAAVYPLKPRTP